MAFIHSQQLQNGSARLLIHFNGAADIRWAWADLNWLVAVEKGAVFCYGLSCLRLFNETWSHAHEYKYAFSWSSNINPRGSGGAISDCSRPQTPSVSERLDTLSCVTWRTVSTWRKSMHWTYERVHSTGGRFVQSMPKILPRDCFCYLHDHPLCLRTSLYFLRDVVPKLQRTNTTKLGIILLHKSHHRKTALFFPDGEGRNYSIPSKWLTVWLMKSWSLPESCISLSQHYTGTVLHRIIQQHTEQRNSWGWKTVLQMLQLVVTVRSWSSKVATGHQA